MHHHSGVGSLDIVIVATICIFSFSQLHKTRLPLRFVSLRAHTSDVAILRVYTISPNGIRLERYTTYAIETLAFLSLL